MTNCIIHIGMHKTGSTSIQGSLNGYNDDKFLYADLGEANHSLAMYSLFAEKPELHYLHKIHGRVTGKSIQEYVNTMRRLLDEAFFKASGRTLIISGEDIAALSPNAIQKLYSFFKEHFAGVTVVGYVRPPASFISSGFQERVKAGQIDSIDLFQEYRNYRGCFGKFDEVFGRDNVHLWKFDPLRLLNGCAVQDFCARIGMQIAPNRIKRINEAFSKQALALLYTYRKFGQGYGSMTIDDSERQKLFSILAMIGGDKFRFSADLIKPVLERNKCDIGWMEDRLGESLAEEMLETQPGAVISEADLLTPDRDVVVTLFAILGERTPMNVKGKTPEEVALLVHALRFCTQINLRINDGAIMLAKDDLVAGWAIGSHPEQPTRVALLVNGKEVEQALANKFRPALKERGVHPTGYCGFNFHLKPQKMLENGDLVEVVPLGQKFTLKNSPMLYSDNVEAVD